MEAVGGTGLIPIIGMHRSGTSALAGALHKLGADLGPESYWLQPAADNPRGFFEFVPLVDLNRDVLGALGGTWSSPPPLPPGWMNDDRLTELRERVRDLSIEIPERMVVKDPRLSLVQPLWEEACTIPASVLCLRHPIAVADSLFARNEFDTNHGLFLWFRYNAAARLNRPDAIVIEYESLLADPIPSLQKVAGHIDLKVSAKTVEAAAGAVYRDMAHHWEADLPDTPIGVLCRRLYDLLRTGESLESDELVWIWSRLATELPWAGPSDRDLSRTRNQVTELEREIDRLIEQNQRRESRLHRLETELRQALRTVDIVSIAETADLLRSQEQ
jgi:hypothetical protein